MMSGAEGGGFRLEPLELTVRTALIENHADEYKPWVDTYLVGLVYEEQNYTYCYVGTIWNATDEKPVVLENDSTRFIAPTKEAAYDWYETVTGVRLGGRS